MDLQLTGVLFDSEGPVRSGRPCSQFNYPYESIFSLVVKFAGQHHLTVQELRNSLFAGEEAQQIVELGNDRLDWKKFVTVSRLPMARRKQAFAEYYLGPSVRERFGYFRRTRIRYCPQCVMQGFHSEIHQMRFFEKCPLHRIPLSSNCAQCGRDYAPGIFNSSPYLCRCGHELLRFELDKDFRIFAHPDWCRFKAIAEWFHEIGTTWDAARQTIVPINLLSNQSPGNESSPTVATNRFRRILDVWSYVGSSPFPECAQDSKAGKRRIDFSVVDLKAERCDWPNHWGCLGFVYIRRLCAIMKRYGTGHEEIAAMLAWRIFWEGIPVLQSSLGMNEVKADRLEEPLCRNLDRLLGDFVHVRDLFGPETWKWIFDDILQRTFSESVEYVRMRLYEGKRVIPSITGSKLVAYTISQRDNKNYIFW